MLESVQQFVEYMQGLEEPQRGWAMTWLVIDLIARVMLYLITGIVVWALGRRLILAATYAWKESRRGPA
jgi:hypothetical protein